MQHKQLACDLLIKSADDTGVFTGYGSVFDVVDSYSDVVQRGAFLETLNEWAQKGRLPPILWQHRLAEPIGVFTKIHEDDHGLHVEGRLLVDDDPLARRAFAHLRAKSITGLSIGYTIKSGGGRWDDQAGVYRLTNLNLCEISLVTIPANDQAVVDSVKSATESPKHCEKILRDAGFSRVQAKRLMSGGFAALSEPARDASTDSDVLDALRALKSTLSGN